MIEDLFCIFYCIENSDNVCITEASGGQSEGVVNITFFAFPSKLKAFHPNTDITSQGAVPRSCHRNHNGAVVRVNC